MKNKFFIPILLIIVVLASVAVFSLVNIVNTAGFVEANVLKVQGNTIILGRDCKAIVADTSEERAQSVEAGIEKVILGRPTTHDIFVDTLRFFNISLDAIQLTKFDGKSYYADLILVSGNKVFRLDSRPSDAIALAVRMNSTMLINQSLLETYGQDICL
jgi:bifunctional DNase/RNase